MITHCFYPLRKFGHPDSFRAPRLISQGWFQQDFCSDPQD
jgi:hypothetical protein